MLKKALGALRAGGVAYVHEIKKASRNTKEVLRIKVAAIDPAIGAPDGWEHS